MNILLYNQQKDLPLSIASARKMVSFLLEKLKITCDEISIHFVSSKKISLLHADFFDDPTVTDCISFPMDFPTPKAKNDYHILGEVFVCPQVAIDYAKKHDKDPYEETSLYVVHGLLHLIGYDDLDPAPRKKMRQKERACLKLLRAHKLFISKKNIVQNTSSKV